MITPANIQHYLPIHNLITKQSQRGSITTSYNIIIGNIGANTICIGTLESSTGQTSNYTQGATAGLTPQMVIVGSEGKLSSQAYWRCW